MQLVPYLFLIFATMLHSIKHILSVILLSLFLYPLIYPSIHVFEHRQDSHCCGHCSGPQKELPLTEDAAAVSNLQDADEECPVCNFHYAKLQVKSSLNHAFVRDSNNIPVIQNHPGPFVLFQGFIFSLRAPPMG